MINYLLSFIFQGTTYFTFGILFNTFIIKKKKPYLYDLLAVGMSITYIIVLFISISGNKINRFLIYIFIVIIFLLTFFKIKNKKRLKEILKKIFWLDFLFFLLFYIIISIFLFLIPTYGYDGILNFAAKAKHIYDYGFFSLFDKDAFLCHIKYPIFLPIQEYFSGLLYGKYSNEIISISFSYYMLLIFLFVYERFIDYKIIKILILLLFVLTPIHWIQDKTFIAKYADFPLAVFFMLSIFSEKDDKNDEKTFCNVGLVYGVTMMTIKNEGFLLFLIYLFISGYKFKNIKQEITKNKIFGIIIMLLIFTSFMMKFSISSEETDMQNLWLNRSRVSLFPQYLKLFLGYFFNIKIWSLNLFASFIIIILDKNNKRLKISFLIYILISIILFSLIDVKNSFDRIIYHFYPLLLITTIKKVLRMT
ncbi:MAG: hypothetical protein ABIN11_06440 [candidate division WOR-3 bacterium]